MTTQAPEQEADSAAAKVLAILAMYEAATITQDTAAQAIATATFAGKAVASRWADAYISTLANVRPTGLIPDREELDRLADAAQTVLSEDAEATQERLERLARAEVLSSKQQALRAAIESAGFEFWQRIGAADCCEEICRPLDNEIQPVKRIFWAHPLCRCRLVPYGERTQQPEPVEATQSPLFTITRGVERTAS